MSCRGSSTIGRSGLAALLALALVALCLPAGASAAGTGSITGTVTELAGGAAIIDASVCAESTDESRFECAVTGVGGTYAFPDLEAGEYIVGFFGGESNPYLVRQYFDGVHNWWEADAVTVEAGVAKSGIDAALVEGGAISGRLTAVSNGAPLGEVFVCSWLEGPEEVESCAETAADGSYEINGVPAGANGVEFFPLESEYEPATLRGVLVSPGITKSNVNAALSRAAIPDGRISGNVYAAATHQPLAGVAVCAIDAFGESRGCAHTGKAGAYAFIQVPAGSWRVAFSPSSSEFEPFEPGEITVDAWPTQFWNLKPTLAQADPVSIGQGSVVAGVDGLLGPGPAGTGGSLTPPFTGPPAAATTPTPVVVKPAPKPLGCRKGTVKKTVKGKSRCVRKHRHHKRHQPKHRHH